MRVDVRCWIFAWFAMVTSYSTQAAQRIDAAAAGDRDRQSHRVFASSRFSMDDILSRPYNPDVPMGCVGDRLWASSPQGWAFRDDVHWLYLTNLKAFDIELRDEH